MFIIYIKIHVTTRLSRKKKTLNLYLPCSSFIRSLLEINRETNLVEFAALPRKAIGVKLELELQ